MTKETTLNQAIAVAAKKFDAKQRAARDVAKKKHLLTGAELLAPWKPFGNPSLLPGEKATDFRCLLAEAAEEYRPRTLHQRLIVWDIVMVTWQIGRLRRIDAGLLDLTVQPQSDVIAFDDFVVRGDANRCEPKRPTVKPLPAATEVSLTVKALALCFTQNVDVIERNQKLITALERRRDVLFRELARLQTGPGPQTSEPITLDVTSQEVDDD